MSARSIVLASYITFGVFVVTIVPDAAGLHAFDGLASVTALGLFLVSLPIWIYAFGLSVVHSARGDDINVPNLFFLSGSAPSEVRRPTGQVLVAVRGGRHAASPRRQLHVRVGRAGADPGAVRPGGRARIAGAGPREATRRRAHHGQRAQGAEEAGRGRRLIFTLRS